jgi:hypothetical protein
MDLSDRRKYLLRNPPSPLTKESAEERLALLEKSFDAMWSYNKIMWHFWCWDIRKMTYDVETYDKIMRCK